MYRRIIVLEIAEVVRLLRAGESDRKIVELLALNRRTVAKYRVWAQEQGVLEGVLPSARTLQELLDRSMPKVLPPQQGSTVARYREEIGELRTRGMEVAARCGPRDGRSWMRMGRPVRTGNIRQCAPAPLRDCEKT